MLNIFVFYQNPFIFRGLIEFFKVQNFPNMKKNRIVFFRFGSILLVSFEIIFVQKKVYKAHLKTKVCFLKPFLPQI